MRIEKINKDTFAIVGDCEILITNKKGLREISMRMDKAKIIRKNTFIAKQGYELYTYLGKSDNDLNIALNIILNYDNIPEEDLREDIVSRLDFHDNSESFIYTEYDNIQVLLQRIDDNRDFNYIDISKNFIENEINPILKNKI